MPLKLCVFHACENCWNLHEYQILVNRVQKLINGAKRLITVVFSPDGKTLASASADNTIKLWNRDTGKEISTLSGHSDSVFSVVFSPDGKTLASASADNSIKLWNRDTGKLISTLEGHGSWVNSVVFSSDGKTLASASFDKTIKLWNLDIDDLLAQGCSWLKDYLASHPDAVKVCPRR
ncbi:WD40 repeat domain-containing protein [uncultured Nostoc sp.]|uniref:WD40 repeat domain-containing protein n=1 Tax=Nostoc sp. TaxID=1180 RepID=UPI0035CA1AB2